MQLALAHYYLAGVKTNIPFLQAICQHPQFQKAELSTDFLNRESINLAEPNKELALLMALGFDYLQTIKQLKDPVLQDTFAWQMHSTMSWSWQYFCEGQHIKTRVVAINHSDFSVYIDNAVEAIKISARLDGIELSLQVDNSPHPRTIFKAIIENQNKGLTVYLPKAPALLNVLAGIP